MSSDQPSDAEIAQEIREGNSRRFDLLVNRYLPGLVGFFRYLRVPESLIDDMLQETFFRAHQKIALYDEKRSFMTWLTVVGRNIYFSERRKDRPPPDPVEAETITGSGEDEIIVRETARELLNTLDEPSRFLVELRIFRDLSFAEIAEMTGEPEPTLRVRMHRILHRLRLQSEKAEQKEVGKN